MKPPIDPQDPQQGSGDPLAAALLPVLLHRINNVTQLLTSVNAVLALAAADQEAGGEPSPIRGQDLLDAAADAQELGWLLGVLGCGLGADLLLERCEPRGLDATLRLVAQALRRAGADLRLEPDLPWPSLTSAVPSHGDLCWTVAFGLWFAAAEGVTLRRTQAASDAPHVLTCSTTDSAVIAVDWSSVRAALGQRLPGAELHTSDSGWELHLPAAWLKAD